MDRPVDLAEGDCEGAAIFEVEEVRRFDVDPDLFKDFPAGASVPVFACRENAADGDIPKSRKDVFSFRSLVNEEIARWIEDEDVTASMREPMFANFTTGCDADDDSLVIQDVDQFVRGI
jgi:hypothetical protein